MRHLRVKQLYLDCLELRAEQRDGFLEHECAQDRELHHAVSAMLDFDARRPDFLRPDSIPALMDDLPAPTSHLPATIGRFRVLSRLGDGGMGAVFEVEQDRPQRRVALKLLHPAMVETQALRRFEREAEILGRLHHAGIAGIYESGTFESESGPQPYLTMELVHGESLTRHVRLNSIGTRERVELLARTCDAVHYAHQRGVIHRDLKPANILVDGSGAVKILDFGVAQLVGDPIHQLTCLTRAGQVVGTLAYMSPEQARGEHDAIDARSDVYSLGVLLFELISGELPHQISSTFLPDAIRTICEDEPRRLSAVLPNLRGDLETITRKTLERERDRRYPSAAALAADIRHYLNDEPIEARPASRVYSLRKFVRRNRVMLGSALCVLAALTAGLVSSLSFGLAEARERRRAELMSEEASAQAYQAGMLAAQLAFEAGNNPSAIQQLEALPAERRGWGWHAVRSLLHRTLGECKVEDLFGAAFLDDERVLAVDAHGSAWLWDAAEQRVTPLGATVLGARPVALARDGRLLVSYFAGELIVSTPLGSAPVIRIPFPHGEPAPGNSAVISLDSGRLSFLTTDKALFLVELGPFPEVARLGEGEVEGADLCFSPDGSLLASGEVDQLRLWDLTCRSERWVHVNRSTVFHRMVFDTSRGWLLACGDGGIGSYELDTGESARYWTTEKLGMLGVGAPFGLDIDPTGECLAAQFRNGEIRLLDAETGRLLMEAEPHDAEERCRVLFGTHGNALLSFSFGGDTLRLWDSNLEPSAVIDAHDYSIYPLVMSPDGSRIATGAWDGNTRLWDIATRRELAVLHSGGCVWALAFAPDGTTIASGLRKGGLVLWDTRSGLASGKFPEIKASGLAYSRDGLRLAIGDTTGRLHIQDARTGKELWSETIHADRIESVAWSPDDRYLAVGSQAAVLSLRETTKYAEIARAKGPRNGPDGMRGVLSLAFAPDGQRLASGWGGSQLILWEVPGLTDVRHFEGHRGPVFSVAFSPDGRRLASGGRDGPLRIWDPESGGLLLSLRGHHSDIHSLAFTPDGRFIATGSGDATVRLWDSAPRATSWREQALALR